MKIYSGREANKVSLPDYKKCRRNVVKQKKKPIKQQSTGGDRLKRNGRESFLKVLNLKNGGRDEK